MNMKVTFLYLLYLYQLAVIAAIALSVLLKKCWISLTVSVIVSLKLHDEILPVV